MASGFCVSMLMLSLITVGTHAAGNVHRHGSKTLRPHSAQAETLPRSYRPAPFSYEGSQRPRAYVASSKIPGRLSAETSKPWGSVAGHGQSGYSRQVNSYSQPRSVSSYRSASVLTPQQQPEDSVYQRRPGMREPSSQGEKRYGSSVVSSGAIMMQAPEKPSQVPSSSPGTGVLKTKAKTWDGVNAPSAKSPGSAPQPPLNHPAFSVPAVLQTNKAMWDSVNAPSAKSPGSAPQPPLNHPAFSVPAVLQTKDAMWGSINAPSAKSPGLAPQPPLNHPAFSVPAVLQTKDAMWGSINAPSAKSPGSAPEPPLNHPAFSAPAVLQTNNAMWGSINAPGKKSPVYTAQRHQRPSLVPGMLQPNPGRLVLYTSSATSPHSTSQRHQKLPSFSAPVVQQTNQMWGSMFSPDSSKNLAADPRSSRPVMSGYYRGLQSSRPETRQQEKVLTRRPVQLGSPATSVHQRKDVGSNPQMKPGLRSSRPANMASLDQRSGRLPQLSYNRD